MHLRYLVSLTVLTALVASFNLWERFAAPVAAGAAPAAAGRRNPDLGHEVGRHEELRRVARTRQEFADFASGLIGRLRARRLTLVDASELYACEGLTRHPAQIGALARIEPGHGLQEKIASHLLRVLRAEAADNPSDYDLADLVAAAEVELTDLRAAGTSPTRRSTVALASR